MTTGLAVMLAGTFGVPAALLWAGHRLRRRPPRWRAAFWGALVGHVVAVPAAVTAAVWPPTEWGATDVVRGALGWWGLLVAPLVGAALGAGLARVGADRRAAGPPAR
jgi:hypothetical protein